MRRVFSFYQAKFCRKCGGEMDGPLNRDQDLYDAGMVGDGYRGTKSAWICKLCKETLTAIKIAPEDVFHMHQIYEDEPAAAPASEKEGE